MNESFQKAAQLSPTETFILSLLGGAGTFAGMRTLQDAMQKIHGQPKPKNNSNSVELMMHDPMSMSSPVTAGQGTAIPQLSKAAEGEGGWWAAPYLAGAVGIPAGFLGAKGLYDKYQSNQQQKQIDDAKQKYMMALQQAQMANQKIAAETPCIDGFCEEFVKESGLLDTLRNTFAPAGHSMTDNILDAPGHAMGLAGDTAFKLAPDMFGSTPPPKGISTADLFAHATKDPALMAQGAKTVGDQANAGWQTVKDTATAGANTQAKNTWLALAALTGGLGLGTGVYYHNKKKENEQKAQYPTSVTYATK